MGTRALISCAAVLVAGDPALALDAPDGDSSSCCATIAPGWMLFADESQTVPDCWRLPRIEVDEISICEHAVQFLFVADERGSPHVSALVFPRPSAELVETRLHLARSHPRFSPTLANLELRYAEMLANLRDASSGRLVPGSRMRFDAASAQDLPVIQDPSRRLGFSWLGREFLLRGYLDVYLTLLS
jgi:hypothetical protein